jgi:hypothetical protein
MSPGSVAFHKLMNGPDTFLIPYNTIKYVDFAGKKKWGMGPILHAGILSLGLAEGRKREFILLGAANGDGIRNSILIRAGVMNSH